MCVDLHSIGVFLQPVLAQCHQPLHVPAWINEAVWHHIYIESTNKTHHRTSKSLCNRSCICTEV